MNIVEIKNVSKSYQEDGRDRKILENVNLTISQGDFIHLKGNVGAGKTTLIELIAGIETPDSGEITVFGRSPDDPSSRNWIGMMTQKIRSPDKLRIEEMVNLFRGFYHHPLPLDEILNRSGLQGKRRSFADSQELCGGEERLLHFALAIAGDPQLLILDEPTANLAPEAVEEIFQQIREFFQQGKTILLVTHPVSDLEKISDLVTQEVYLERDGDNCRYTEKLITGQSLNELLERENDWELSKFDRIKKTVTSLARQVQMELLQLLRILISLFSVLIMYCFTALLPKGSNDYLPYLVGIAGFGLLLMTMQTFGTKIATERKQGWIESLRTTPLPAWVYLTSKVLVALILGGLGISITFVIGIVHLGIQQSLVQWALIAGGLLLGVIPYAMLTFAIAYLCDVLIVQSASLVIIAVALFTSNCIPLPSIPRWLETAIPFSPFYHYAQLVMGAGNLGSSGMIVLDSYPSLHVEWMIWSIVAAGLFAVWSYRRNSSFG